MDTSRCGAIGRKALGLLVALCALGGCVEVQSRVVIDPAALPQLAESYAKDPEGSHSTRAITSEERSHSTRVITSEEIELQGEILRVEVRVRSEENPRSVSVERFNGSFMAGYTADRKLAVVDTIRRKEFTPFRVQDVVVTYLPASNRRKQAVGIGLILGSVVPLGLGGAGLASAASRRWSDKSGFDGQGVEGIPWVLTVLGIGLAIPGIVLFTVGAVRDPTAPRHRPSTSLRVMPGPGGVMLQGAF